MNKKGALTWEQIVAAVLVVVIIVVLIILFVGQTGKAKKDISRCQGLIGLKELSGQCYPGTKCPQGYTMISTFGSDCAKGQICCIGEQK